jgi:hypothetical protein
MSGTGLLLVIEFFLREATKFLRRIGTGDWPVYDAIVVSSKLDFGISGCDLVTIRYKYRNAESRLEGIYKQPFINENYAEAYLRRYPGGAEFPVIVSPHDPSRSIPAEGRIKFTKVR